MSDQLQSMFANRRIVLADGATGTHILHLAAQHGIALPATQELLNLECPDLVRRHHRAYLRAGSDILLTNSWAANKYALEDAGICLTCDQIHELNSSAARLLKEEAASAGREVVCAGSVGPTGWVVAAPDDDAPLHAHELAYKEAVSVFLDQMCGLLKGGVDIIWIESQISAHEANAAIAALAAAIDQTQRSCPYAIAMVFNRHERTQAEYDLAHFVEEFGRRDDAPVAFGMNCGYGPEIALELVAKNRAILNGTPPLLLKANCGSPRREGNRFIPSGLSPKQMGRYAQLASDYGVKIVGACCGSLPEHIAAMRSALDAYAPNQPLSASQIHAALQ